MGLVGAAEFLRLFERGEISAERFMRELLERISASGSLNAFSWLDEPLALEAAKATDKRRAKGEQTGLLAGLPIAVKDNINTVGFPTSAGTVALKAFRPRSSAPVWQRLADEGAILLGKTNMHELAAGSTSSNPIFGIVQNPHAPGRIPGGSSGGTAAAIAAGLAPAGLGTDTVGSIRAPSSFCGIAGLRPSTALRKEYPSDGVVPLTSLFDTVGPMAASAADLAAINRAITGAPTTEVDLGSVRIGISADPFWNDLDPQVEQVARSALDRLVAAGLRLVTLDLGDLVARASDLHGKVVSLRTTADLADFLNEEQAPVSLQQVMEGIVSKDVRARYETPPESGLDFSELKGELRALQQDFDARLRRAAVAAIVYPTSPILPPFIREEGDRVDDTELLNGREVSSAFTPVRHLRYAAALGVPALTIPASRTSSGLPVGMEFAAPAHEDAMLLSLGCAAEAVLRSRTSGAHDSIGDSHP